MSPPPTLPPLKTEGVLSSTPNFLASLLLLLSLVTVGSGCATFGAGSRVIGAHEILNGDDDPMQRKVLPLGDTQLIVRFEKGDKSSAKAVEVAVEKALPKLERWGRFESPVVITIHPTHRALEEAVNRPNHAFLRAWARYDTIDLQSTRTWGAFESHKSHLQELITHELTHCLMYQLAATPDTWQRKGIPFWFREGMASVTASQGYRRAKDSDLWRYLRNNPKKDPVLQANALYQWESEIVYAAAHRSFDFLLLRYSEARIQELMRVMKDDELRFSEAFEQVIGISSTAFAHEYLRYLRWEGWRESGEEPFRPYSASLQALRPSHWLP